MRIALYLFLLSLVVYAAYRHGRSPERWAALICVVGTALTVLARHRMPDPLARFDEVSFLIDVGVFLGFVTIALRSTRFWPIWVAGLQLTGTTVHLLKLLNPDLMRFVVAAALAFWSYPILLLIGLGALRTRTIERWRGMRHLPGGP